MKNRRHFLGLLGAVSGAALGAAAAGGTDARVTSSPSASAAGEAAPSPLPPAAPPGEPQRGAPSPAALALAGGFRAFDPRLSDGEIETIARTIDANRAAAAALNPKRKPLRNSDEMVARFAVAPVARD